ERKLTGSHGVTFTDNGPNDTFEASIDTTFFIAGSGITFTTSSNHFTISTIQPWIDNGTGSIHTTSSVLISKNLTVQGHISGSITRLADGVTPYLYGIGGILITTASNGQLVISGSGGGFASTAYFADVQGQF